MNLEEINIKKRLIIGLFALALIWAANLFYFYRHHLSEPLFLKHYYDLSSDEKIDFQLRYLVNHSDDRKVQSITVSGIEPIHLAFSEYDEQSYIYQKMKVLHISIDLGYIKQFTQANKLEFSNLVIQYLDGTIQVVDIGKILINIDSEGKGEIPMEIVEGMGSENSGYAQFKILKGTKIKGIKTSFEDLVGDALNLTIDSVPLESKEFPFVVSSDEHIRLRYSFAFDKRNNSQSFNYHRLKIYFDFEDTKGKKGKVGYFMIQNWPIFDEAAVREIVKGGE